MINASTSLFFGYHAPLKPSFPGAIYQALAYPLTAAIGSAASLMAIRFACLRAAARREKRMAEDERTSQAVSI